MSKGQIFAIASIIIVLVAGGIALFFVLKPKETKDSSASSDFTRLNNNPTVVAPEQTKTYSDASGFSFKYPVSFGVKDITPNDDMTYSFLELSKQSEKITIRVEDTTYKNLSEWEKDNTQAKVVGASSLAGVSAKQYKVLDKFVTVGIDQGVLYYIEYKGSTSEKIYDDLVSSFSFSSSASGSQSDSIQTNSDTIYEEEETIE